jgi:hypothetical protein
MLAEWLEAAVDPVLSKTSDWVGLDFKVMRRTNASLGHGAKVDPKVSADQRGHGIGVSLDVYTSSSIGQKAIAAKKLEDSVLGRKRRPDAEAESVVRALNVVQKSARFFGLF